MNTETTQDTGKEEEERGTVSPMMLQAGLGRANEPRRPSILAPTKSFKNLTTAVDNLAFSADGQVRLQTNFFVLGACKSPYAKFNGWRKRVNSLVLIVRQVHLVEDDAGVRGSDRKMLFVQWFSRAPFLGEQT